jgi:hypothetical protein
VYVVLYDQVNKDTNNNSVAYKDGQLLLQTFDDLEDFENVYTASDDNQFIAINFTSEGRDLSLLYVLPHITNTLHCRLDYYQEGNI